MEQAARELTVRVLGGFEIRRDDDVLLDACWRRRKAQSLIKLLALQPGRRLHREQVLEALWPDLSPDAAANNLSQNVHHVRSALARLGVGAPLIAPSGNLLAIAPGVLTDIEEFRARAETARANPGCIDGYRNALAAYRGDLLPDDLYEPWTDRARRDLWRIRRDLLIEMSALPDALDDPPSAIDALQQLLVIDPLDERVHRLLIRLYASIGDRAGAVRQYRELSDVLDREVQVAPSSETETLFREAVKENGPSIAGRKRGEQREPGRLEPDAGDQAVATDASSSAERIQIELISRVSHTVESAIAECERHSWPAFVTNEYAEVVGANSVFQRLVGIDLRSQKTEIGERNLLSVASDPSFADHLLNWDETITTMVSVFKATDAAPEDIERPGPYLMAVLERFLGGDPAYVNRLIRIWQEAPITWDRREHWSYPIVWRTSGRRIMRFEAIVTSASFVDRLTINDWIPLDGRTWRELQRMAEHACADEELPASAGARTMNPY